jgi:hypothetical protein
MHSDPPVSSDETGAGPNEEKQAYYRLACLLSSCAGGHFVTLSVASFPKKEAPALAPESVASSSVTGGGTGLFFENRQMGRLQFGHLFSSIGSTPRTPQ